MNKEEIQKILDELYTVRPEILNDKAKRLFEAIMQIADERDKAYKIIDKMAEQLAGLTIWNDNIEEALILGDKEEVKEYFKKVVEKGEQS